MRAHRLLAIPAVGLAALGSTTLPLDAQTDTVTLYAGMSGAQEVPERGDQNGSGLAVVEIDPGTGAVCYELTVRNIAPAGAAHIHVGERGVAGGVVLGLNPPTTGSSSGCAVNAEVAQAVAANPSGYYVNVHNGEFPGGAVRGQLAGPSA